MYRRLFKDYWRQTKAMEAQRLKILAPKRMLKRLPIALVEVKLGNILESLLHEIRQVVYSMDQSKEITEKVYHVKLNQNKHQMDIIFMNLWNSETYKPDVLILNLDDKMDLRRGEKRITLSNCSI